MQTSPTPPCNLRKQLTFYDNTTSEKWVQKFRTDSLRSRRRLLMTCHYPDLGSASDWLKQISHASQPIRGNTQIWEAICHQYGISSRGGVTKCWLFPVADPGEGPRGAHPLPLFLDGTEAQRAEIFFCFRPPPPLLGVRVTRPSLI